jgi:hypothetical protein
MSDNLLAGVYLVWVLVAIIVLVFGMRKEEVNTILCAPFWPIFYLKFILTQLFKRGEP